MKKILPVLAIAMTITLSNCSKSDSTPNPVADFSFTAVGSNTHAPATLNFSNSSVNGASFAWDFGDGSTSTQRDASHKYVTAGSYPVKLTTTAGSKTNVKTQVINILAPYTKMALTKISLSSTTETSSYTAYFRFSDASNTELFRSANITITPSGLPASWALTTPFLFNNLAGSYFIEVWKDGTISDTKVASGPLVPTLYNTGTEVVNSYPTSITSLQGLSFTVQWQ